MKLQSKFLVEYIAQIKAKRTERLKEWQWNFLPTYYS